MFIIYHNPKCSKSRAGLEYLKSKTSGFSIREYLKEPLTAEELKNLVMKLNIEPFGLVRTQEDYYKKQLKGREFTGDEWIKIITENPRLLQRPVVEKGYKAVLAQPPEMIDNLF